MKDTLAVSFRIKILGLNKKILFVGVNGFSFTSDSQGRKGRLQPLLSGPGKLPYTLFEWKPEQMLSTLTQTACKKCYTNAESLIRSKVTDGEKTA